MVDTKIPQNYFLTVVDIFRSSTKGEFFNSIIGLWNKPRNMSKNHQLKTYNCETMWMLAASLWREVSSFQGFQKFKPELCKKLRVNKLDISRARLLTIVEITTSLSKRVSGCIFTSSTVETCFPNLSEEGTFQFETSTTTNENKKFSTKYKTYFTYTTVQAYKRYKTGR